MHTNTFLLTRYSTFIRHCTTMSINHPFKISQLFEFTAPHWASDLKGIPSHKLKLAQLNTPINKWDLPGVPDGFEVYIKRDDMTGNTLSGNKIRKLNFLLADALQKGCKHVITSGGLQSNHCRATAVACSQLGLKTHLVLRSDLETIEDVGCDGNLLLDRLSGAEIYLVPLKAPYATELKPRMERIAAKIKSEMGEDSFLIPVGGSDETGVWGYIDAFHEMLQQGLVEHFDDIVFACGSGGTADGLLIANYLSKSNLRIHGINVSDNSSYFYEHCNGIMKTIGLTEVRAEDLFNAIDGYKGRGYALTTHEELDFGVKVAVNTGIMLDATYTLKAVTGLISELQTNPNQFKGKRILFIHTGGVFGMFDGRLNNRLLKPNSVTNNIHLWNKMNEPPF